MAKKIRNVSGVARRVPWLGGRLVMDKQVVEVPDELEESFLAVPAHWHTAEPPAKAAKKAAASTNEVAPGADGATDTDKES